MPRRRYIDPEAWQILLKAPRWSAPLCCTRQFSTPEAAAFYADALVDIPELWVQSEDPALCRLLEAEDPQDVQVRICPAN
jgi:hypothetical protein